MTKLSKRSEDGDDLTARLLDLEAGEVGGLLLLDVVTFHLSCEAFQVPALVDYLGGVLLLGWLRVSADGRVGLLVDRLKL